MPIADPRRRELRGLERREFRRAVQKGKTQAELATVFRSSSATVGRWMREMQLMTIKKPRPITSPLTRNAAYVFAMLAAHQTAADIAATFGVSRQRVWLWLKRHDRGSAAPA